MIKSILIVEDNLTQAHIYAETLVTYKGYKTHIAKNGEEARRCIQNELYDAILLDINLPDANGLDILKEIKERHFDTPVIIMTAETSVTALETKRLGASDFVAKPVRKERLLISLENSLETKRLQKIEQNFHNISRNHFCDFIGASPEMQIVYHMIENAAKTDASALITGESGTGKELAARAIHELGHRQEHPFIALNCGAIPENLMESEFFGHVKGSFTGAINNRDGAATMADRGSLFLDELIEMPLNMQVKLLRFIQTGRFSKVGDITEKSVDVRFICATNKKPLESVKNKTFREDLFYRLNVVPIQIPPLRERGEDITLLAEYFLNKASKIEGKRFKKIDDTVKSIFLNYEWPGNVRELENTIRRIVVMNDSATLTPDMISDFSTKEVSETTNIPLNITKKRNIKSLHDYEREIIEKTINLCDGNITEAAKFLEINPATIHRKRKKWLH